MSLNVCLLQSLLEVGDFEQAQDIILESPTCAAVTGGSYNSLPLLVALMHKPPLCFIEALIHAYPDALSIKNDVGMLPLRVAIRNEASNDVIMKLMNAYPDAVSAVGVSGKTCLHLACTHHVDSTVIDRLLQIWPQAAACRDGQGWYPLHMASLCKDSDTTIRAVLAAYPDAALVTCSSDGELPLHLAALQGASLDTLRALHEANPEAVTVRTHTHGWLPLHLACSQRKAWPDSIQFLVQVYRDGAKFRGKHSGALPLHIAAKNGCAPQVLDILVEAYPAAMTMKNNAGETPVANDASHYLLEVAH